MGAAASKERKIKCFNELNTRFGNLNPVDADKRRACGGAGAGSGEGDAGSAGSDRATNYFVVLYTCKSGLDATFVREYPKGCYNFFCEDCYYSHYSEGKDSLYRSVNLDQAEQHPAKKDSLNFQYDEDNSAYYCNFPILEANRDMKKGPWPEEMRMSSPKWIEAPQGFDLRETVATRVVIHPSSAMATSAVTVGIEADCSASKTDQV